MEKAKADQLITEYLPKIYGFAVDKSFFYEEAEEIASEIVEEVYLTLLRREEIYNLDGYVWRISEHCYAKYVASKRKCGVSIDGMEIPYTESFPCEGTSDEILLLRREIAFLTKVRRRIVYSFYFENKSIAQISESMSIPEGTVKWHLSKAKKELRRGFTMERKIGKLGLNPINALCFNHSGWTGNNEGPEFYLGDKLNLNIVYSVYFSPKTAEEIAEELGVTPVFIEDRIALLEDNGFLTRLAGNKFTTYVLFDPETYSKERVDGKRKMQKKAAELLVKEYVPLVRASMEQIKEVWLPTGNRELFEAAMIQYAVSQKCRLETGIDLSKYQIQTTAGGQFMAWIELESTPSDPDYQPEPDSVYEIGTVCGPMTRGSYKYPIYAWTLDTRYTTRKGMWKNNRTADYEYLYEYMTGTLSDRPADAEKLARLREIGFLNKEGRVSVLVIKGNHEDIFGKIPSLPEEMKKQFADFALEYASAEAKAYPEQMWDRVIAQEVGGFIGNAVGMMVKDILYRDGIFKPLTEEERIATDLLIFTDKLPG